MAANVLENRASPSISTASSASLPPSKDLYSQSSKQPISSPQSDHDLTSEDVKSEELSVVEQTSPDRRPQSSPVHGHILPSGWTCHYEPDNDQYWFEFLGLDKRDEAVEVKTPTVDHPVQTSRRPTKELFECKYGYHFPCSPTPSMISDLARQVQKGPATGAAPKTKQVGYGRLKWTLASVEEEQAQRLGNMFPTATAAVIDQMIRIYHGREGLIKAALISLGYKRATEYDKQQTTAQSPIMMMMAKPSSKKLFEKLVSYFPDRDETLIKSLMFKHKEVEHEIISVLVESGQSSDALGADHLSTKIRRKDGSRLDTNGAIMKLRYLKFLFPHCQEIELYHLLHCNDLNTLKVIEIVEKRGHKRANIDEVMQNRKSQTQQMKAQQAAHAAKEKAPIVDPIEAHKNRTKPMVSQARANNMKDNLKKNFPEVADQLLLRALEAADYNEPLAKKFIEEMSNPDETLYRQRYEIYREPEPTVVFYPCKGVQKDGSSFMSVTSNERISIPREVVECTNALALLKVDACTFTQDDFVEPRFTHAIGRRIGLGNGSNFRKKIEWRNALRQGAKECLRLGSHYEQVCAERERPKPNQRAKGRNASLAKGRTIALNHGHNPSLVQAIHPFYLEAPASM